MKVVKSDNFELILLSNLRGQIVQKREENLKKVSRIANDGGESERSIYKLLGKDDGYAESLELLNILRENAIKMIEEEKRRRRSEKWK